MVVSQQVGAAVGAHLEGIEIAGAVPGLGSHDGMELAVATNAAWRESTSAGPARRPSSGCSSFTR
jgi:hypothetical protein